MFINDSSEPLIRAIFRPVGAADARPPFARGELVDGVVLKAISNEKALVKLGGIEMMAQTKVRLMDGQTISGVVEKTSPALTIQLLQNRSTPEAKIAELMRALLPGKTPLADALAKVVDATARPGLPETARRTLDALAPKLAEAIVKDLSTLTPEQTKTALKQSGLFLEGALKEALAATTKEGVRQQAAQTGQTDLKAQLGKALASLETEIGKIVDRMREETTTGATRLLTGGAERKGIAPPAPLTTSAPRPAENPVARTPLPEPNETARPKTDPFVPNKPAVDRNDPRTEQLAQLRETAKGVREAINNLELNQLVNAGRRDPAAPQAQAPSPYLFQLPFMEGATVKNARVYVNPDGGEGSVRNKKEGESGVVFMLEMTRLGPIRVDARIGGGKIVGSVYVEKEPVARFMEKALPDLTDPLRRAGYDVSFDVGVATRARLTEPLESFAPLTPQGLINLKA
jgi:hypothetical protein